MCISEGDKPSLPFHHADVSELACHIQPLTGPLSTGPLFSISSNIWTGLGAALSRRWSKRSRTDPKMESSWLRWQQMREFSPHGLLCSLKLACTCVPAAQHICQPLRAYSYPPCSHLMGRCRIIHDYGGTHILFRLVLHHCTTTSWALVVSITLIVKCCLCNEYIHIRLNT